MAKTYNLKFQAQEGTPEPAPDPSKPPEEQGGVVLAEMCQVCWALVPVQAVQSHMFEQHQVGSPPTVEGPPVVTPQ